MTQPRASAPAILYCHCQYAQAVPMEAKKAVLQHLCASNLPFEAVPDLCELAARRDPALQRLAAAGPLKIAACYPRAIKWLFAAAGAPLPQDQTEVANMRDHSAHDIIAALQSTALHPNLPADNSPPPAGSPPPPPPVP